MAWPGSRPNRKPDELGIGHTSGQGGSIAPPRMGGRPGAIRGVSAAVITAVHFAVILAFLILLLLVRAVKVFPTDAAPTPAHVRHLRDPHFALGRGQGVFR